MSGAPQPAVELGDETAGFLASLTSYEYVDGDVVNESGIDWMSILATRRERGEIEIGDACTQLLERCNAEIAKACGLRPSSSRIP